MLVTCVDDINLHCTLNDNKPHKKLAVQKIQISYNFSEYHQVLKPKLNSKIGRHLFFKERLYKGVFVCLLWPH